MSSPSTLLIADDEKDLREILKKTLSKQGFQVFTAENGRKALTLLKTHDISLLLLDLKMPGMNGIEVLRKVRKSHPEIRVVILTAYGGLSSAREAMKLGAVDYLMKPFDLNILKKVIKEALGEK